MRDLLVIAAAAVVMIAATRAAAQDPARALLWPRRIQIIQNGAPFFDLEVNRFRTLERLDLPPCTRCQE